MEDITENLPAESGKETEASYGKFKTAGELLRAYNALEGEFTKRSQKLREYEREAAEEAELENKVSALVSEYPAAEEYAEELAQEIANNEKLKGKENRLESALLNVLSRKVRPLDELAKDGKVIEKVLNDEGNREKIINNYLDEIKKRVSPVTLPRGGADPVRTPVKPANIREAGVLALKILENE